MSSKISSKISSKLEPITSKIDEFTKPLQNAYSKYADNVEGFFKDRAPDSFKEGQDILGTASKAKSTEEIANDEASKIKAPKGDLADQVDINDAYAYPEDYDWVDEFGVGCKRVADAPKSNNILLAIIGGVNVEAACTPNPYGRRGGPAHTAKIAEIEKKYVGEGWTVRSGGTGNERRLVVDKATGQYRYPDILLEKDGQTIAIQVGKQTAGGLPIPREAVNKALISQADGIKEVIFVPYN